MLLSSTYRNGKRRISWYSYCLSQFHGPTSGWFALYCVWNFVRLFSKRFFVLIIYKIKIFQTADPSGYDWYFKPTELQVLCVLWTLGYMVTDLSMVLFFKKEFGFPYFLIFHHTLIAVTYSLGLLHNPTAGVYFMCAFQVQELTATFLANRWFLLECDMKFSNLYWYNGFFLVGGYITTRVFYGNFVLYRLVTYLPKEILENPFYFFPLGCSIIFQLLQYYFFYSIMTTTFKYLEQRKNYLNLQQSGDKKRN